MRRILIGIALVWISLLCYAQSPGGKGFPSLKVKGKVSNENGSAPMQYVNVAVYSVEDNKLAGGTITDADGDFEINSIKPGEYYLKADFIGFESSQTDNFKLTSQNPVYTAPTIKLSEKSVSINEVEVVANGPAMRYEVDKKVITVDRLIAASGGTAVEVLQDVPSVETDIEGNVSLRGSSNFTVLIDGRQSPLSGSDALNQISASSIDKIEIITNPSAKFDPDGTSGIINIVTKKGKYKGVSFISNASVGNGRNSLNNDNLDDFTYSGDIALTLKQKKFSTTFMVGPRNNGSNMGRTEYLKQSSSDTIKYRELEADGSFVHAMSNAKAQIDYYLTESNTIYLSGGFFDMNFRHDVVTKNITYNNYTTGDNYYLTHKNNDVNPQNWNIVLGDRQEFGSRDHYLEGEFTYRKGDKANIENSKQYSSNISWEEDSILIDKTANTIEDQTEYRFDLDYIRPITKNSKLEAGALIRIDDKTTDYDVYESDVLTDDYSFDYHRYIYGGYVTFTGKLANWPLNYSAGLRAEYTDRSIQLPDSETQDTGYKKLDWYPTGALSYEFLNGNTLQLTYSKRVQRPRDFMLIPVNISSDGFERREGNPGLLPEYTDAVELNYQFVWGSSYLAIETYYRHTKNEIDRVREEDANGEIVHKMINLGKEDHTGIDVSGNFKITKWWTVSPSLSAYYNVAEGMYDDSLRTVTGYSGRGMLNNKFYLTSSTQLQWNNSYRARQENIDGVRYPFYETNLALRQDLLNRKLSLSFSIRDVLGTATRHSITDEEGYYYDSERTRQPRTFRLTLSYKFNQDQKDRNGRNGQTNSSDGSDGSDMMY